MNALPQDTILQGKSNQYKIVKKLGQGSFGITYLATVRIGGPLGYIESDARVAVKEFFMHEINDRDADGAKVTSGSKGGIYDGYKKKFVDEAKNLSKLQHPHIVKVIEYFEANDTVYYVMEYIDGGSLDDYINERGRLDAYETIKIAKQIGEALSFMHSKQMLHLDLKPGNVMIRDNGQPVLIDFGLSKQYDENGNPESSTTVGGGTPGYAPTEQADYQDGEGFPVTMDVYAFGGTMYKMLTGKRPPKASVILNDGFPTSDLKECGVDDEIINCIAKAMAPKKKERYQTVKDFVSAIEKNATTATSKKKQDEELEVYVIEKQDYSPKTDNDKNKGNDNNQNQDQGKNKESRANAKENVDEAELSPTQMTILGNEYFNGSNGKKKNHAEAMKWYRKAAEKGNANALFRMGYMYENGKSVKKDYAEAMKWYRKAAEKGHAEAIFCIGFLYLLGNGVKHDYSLAMKCFKKANEKGYARAAYWVGYMYENGDGVEKDLFEAKKCYKKAAKEGYYPAKEEYIRLKSIIIAIAVGFILQVIYPVCWLWTLLSEKYSYPSWWYLGPIWGGGFLACLSAFAFVDKKPAIPLFVIWGILIIETISLYWIIS